jgi:uncharacterized membrane protein
MEAEKNLMDMNFLIAQIKKDLEKEFKQKMQRRESTARNINKLVDRDITYGERIADKVALIGGSWRFIIGFLFFLIVWMIINTFILAANAYDPYPYILLNLCLSCVAAIQAPIIMMSQNRQAKKDRLESEEDFRTNTRSEVQIQEIVAKLDLFMDLFIKINFEQKEDQFKKIHKMLEEIHEHLHNKKS